MKFLNLFANLFLVKNLSATIQIDINNKSIERAAEQYSRFEGRLHESDRYQEVNNAMEKAGVKAKLQIYKYQRQVMEPVVQGLKEYLQYFTPRSSQCNANGVAQCLLNKQEAAETSGNSLPVQFFFSECADQYKCNYEWNQLPIQKKMKLEQQFGRDQQQLERAYNEMALNYLNEFQQASLKQQNNSQWIQEQYQKESFHILSSWGCNSTCLDKFAAGGLANIGPAIEECDCPRGIRYNRSNEPFGDVDIEKVMSDNEILATPSDSNAEKDLSSDMQESKFGGYYILIVVVFILELIFCFGICCYTNVKLTNAQRREEKQNADFYTFLYQFHKQMADEEQEMQDLYGKAGGATPGGPQVQNEI